MEPAAEEVKEAETVAAPAEGVEQATNEEEEKSLEVAENLVEWLAGPGSDGLTEIERLSGARVAVSGEAAVDGKRSVKIQGKAISVSRARVLLEDKLRNAPTGSKLEEAAATSAQSAPSPTHAIKLAGRGFESRDALVSHIRALQAATADGALLGPEDAFFIFHLATHHPNFADKMTTPVVGFKYGPHEEFKGSRCFFVVRADGSEEGISIMKCVEAALPKGSASRGIKRDREEGEAAPAGTAAEEPQPQRPRREIQVGCILIIEGIPGNVGFEELRDILNGFGHMKYVEFLRDGPPVAAAQTEADAKAEADVQEGADKPTAEENKEAATEKADKEKDDKEVPAADAGKPSEAPATEAGKPPAPEAKADEAAADKMEDEGEEEEDDEASVPVSARARFADAEGAAAAAKGLKEINGKPVSCSILDGEEEQKFWERLWQKADQARQDKGKSKGKGKSSRRHC
eukprot:TRINITY_DN77_c1_g2_i1.p1 TRINITY_DN77_c1_g2~~TRINITY_DN77_c1_g2_i1.p1  ORF type:complete len:471 (+),score=150.70 TRINITY_DN77_c1_g2_i1:32-1414(+)